MYPGTDHICEQVSSGSSFAVLCQICHENLDFFHLQSRRLHYEQHFQDSGQVSTAVPLGSSSLLSASKPSPPKKWTLRLPLKENDIFWYPSQTDGPPSTFSPGIIPVLRRSLLKSHARGELRKAVLCYDRAVHIAGELWDSTWGCGYRNFLMACSVLMDQPFQPLYFPLLDTPIPPSIRNLQRWIEEAWHAGFDAEGKDDLKNLIGTNRWIGTSDLWVAFSFRGIPAELVDFNLEHQEAGVQVVINWIMNYFTPKPASSSQPSVYESLRGATPVINTDLMPIILQHNGHSRTIVGYEVDECGTINLLTFDSGIRLPESIRKVALSAYSSPCPSQPTQVSSKDTSSSQIIGPAAENQTSYCMKRRARDASVRSQPNGTKRRRSINDNSSYNTGNAEAGDNIRTGDDQVVTTGLTALNERPTSNDKGRKEHKVRVAGGNNKEADFHSIIQRFRLSAKKLGKKKQYQILYFPLTAPLTDSERFARRIVTSTKIC